MSYFAKYFYVHIFFKLYAPSTEQLLFNILTTISFSKLKQYLTYHLHDSMDIFCLEVLNKYLCLCFSFVKLIYFLIILTMLINY